MEKCYAKTISCFREMFRKFLYLLMIALLGTGLNSCPEDNPAKPDESTVYGTTKEYEINKFANGEVKDEITGLTFIFKESSDGKLTIKKLLAGKYIDTTKGINFEMKYTGSSSVIIRCDNNIEESAYISMLNPNVISTHFQGEFPEELFISLSCLDTNKIPTEYELYDLDFIKSKVNKVDDIQFQTKLKKESYVVRFAKIKKTASDEVKLREIKFLLLDMRQDAIDMMPAAIQTKILSVLKKYDFSGHGVYPADKVASYVPWTVKGVSKPYFNFLLNDIITKDDYILRDNSHAIAHELGHYFSHIIHGDDFFEKLVNEQNYTPHYIGVDRKNRDFIEEYAHFMDFILHFESNIVTNLRFSYFTEAPTDIFRSQYEKFVKISWNRVLPKYYDFPKVESFGAFLLARTTSPSNKIQSIWSYDIDNGIKYMEDIPVLGLSKQEALEILFSKPLYSTTELGYELINFLEKKGGDFRYRYPAFFERCGWSYNGKVKIVNSKGEKITNAKAINISQVGPGEVYYAGANSTDENGIIEFNRLFPTSSIIRVFYNQDGVNFKDSMDIDFFIELSKETNKSIDIPQIVIPDASTKPEITSISGAGDSRERYYAGEQITINGKGFGIKTDKAKLMFNQMAAMNIIQWSDTKIIAEIPPAKGESQTPSLIEVYVSNNSLVSNSRFITLANWWLPEKELINAVSCYVNAKAFLMDVDDIKLEGGFGFTEVPAEIKFNGQNFTIDENVKTTDQNGRVTEKIISIKGKFNSKFGAVEYIDMIYDEISTSKASNIDYVTSEKMTFRVVDLNLNQSGASLGSSVYFTFETPFQDLTKIQNIAYTRIVTEKDNSVSPPKITEKEKWNLKSIDKLNIVNLTFFIK